ncbi:unnamed protein product [Strongylus vulgaris]|uniref:Invertebrate defensins family profile domain-containing protein n=1 Tax=Strongylus vulgaris TaxID=40348 RepID=A0A3P7INS2_STRVU|nr:unnamed protein product [Strongylus vulgaris]
MKRLILGFVLFSIVELALSNVYLSTCARMDVPVLEKVAHGACITSCSIQNCGSGHCEMRGGRKTCVCTRCANGGNVPLDLLMRRRG